MLTINMPKAQDVTILRFDDKNVALVLAGGNEGAFDEYIRGKTNILSINNKTFKIKRIYCTIDRTIDFSDRDTVDAINDLPFLKDVPYHMVCNYDYNTHTCTVNKSLKYVETYNFSDMLKYKYAALGKPEVAMLFTASVDKNGRIGIH